MDCKAPATGKTHPWANPGTTAKLHEADCNPVYTLGQVIGFPTPTIEIGKDHLVAVVPIGFKNIILIQVDPERATVISIIQPKLIGSISLGIEEPVEDKLVVIILVDCGNQATECTIPVQGCYIP